jgi:hypothetical protein
MPVLLALLKFLVIKLIVIRIQILVKNLIAHQELPVIKLTALLMSIVAILVIRE